MRAPPLLRYLAAGVLAVYGLVYADLALRARAAYLEGEKYMEWSQKPALKKAFYEAEFARERAGLEREKLRGMPESEYRQRLEVEEFRRDEAVAESSLKYAYHWYKTAVDLFSPPETRWARLSRSRMTQAKELWKAELAREKIPYEDYMLE